MLQHQTNRCKIEQITRTCGHLDLLHAGDCRRNQWLRPMGGAGCRFVGDLEGAVVGADLPPDKAQPSSWAWELMRVCGELEHSIAAGCLLRQGAGGGGRRKAQEGGSLGSRKRGCSPRGRHQGNDGCREELTQGRRSSSPALCAVACAHQEEEAREWSLIEDWHERTKTGCRRSGFREAEKWNAGSIRLPGWNDLAIKTVSRFFICFGRPCIRIPE